MGTKWISSNRGAVKVLCGSRPMRENMKLYNLPRDTWFLINGQRVLFKRLDGMYSVCLTEDGELVHILASADVEVE